MPTNPVEIVAIWAVTDSGVRFKCGLSADGVEHVRFIHGNFERVERFRKYRVLVEIPWDRLQHVARFEILPWPDDVVLVFDVPGMTDSEAQQWGQSKEYREITPSTGTGPADDRPLDVRLLGG